MITDALRRTEWHRLPAQAVLEKLAAAPTGLSRAEAGRRLRAHGPNELPHEDGHGLLALFFAQLTNFMVVLLLAAAVLAAIVGDAKDAVAILAILLLNAVIGCVQDYRAERAIEALKAMAAPTATVLREGQRSTIAASEVVPGDVLWLEAGTIVPADVRLFEVAALKIEEAALTGESVPAEKTIDALDAADLALGDRHNMAYKGTVVTYGRALGVVVATGMATELGKIAEQLGSAGEVETPLQRRLTQLGKRLAVAAVVICAVVFAAGVIRGEPTVLMLMTAVSLAVAAIPESLPAVVTISLALGARRLVKKRALVRRLPAVETLGSVTYVCSDKTGTLTLNRMSAEQFCCDGIRSGHLGLGAPWDTLALGMALNNDASVADDGAPTGDPTELALLRGAAQAGIEKASAECSYPRVREIPFDSTRKCMTTLHRNPAGGFLAITKGAAEVVIERCATVSTAKGNAPMDRAALHEETQRMARDGLRVLAVAMRSWDSLPGTASPDEVECDLTLVGLVGLVDPPRSEARKSVETCRAAGIVPVMITGDHPATARAIAERVGILQAGDQILTGTDLARLAPQQLEAIVEEVRVYARVAPEQKLEIVRALQARGHVVAMTGDGVNDAPALKRADVGVAMGITGTDVAKEASSMVLLDDDFATIVRAVREGRRIYDNLRRFVRYAVTTNSAEVWLVFLAPLLGLPMPLQPIQILWVNLVTDGLPGLALAAEPEESNVMRRPPRPPRESVFGHGLGTHVIWVGVLMAGLAIASEGVLTRAGVASWQTIIFSLVCFSQLFNVLAIRSERDSLFVQGLWSNKPLASAVVITVALQLAVIYVPALREVFKTQPLSIWELAATVAIASIVFFAVEIEKWLRRRREGRRAARPSTTTCAPSLTASSTR